MGLIPVGMIQLAGVLNSPSQDGQLGKKTSPGAEWCDRPEPGRGIDYIRITTRIRKNGLNFDFAINRTNLESST